MLQFEWRLEGAQSAYDKTVWEGTESLLSVYGIGSSVEEAVSDALSKEHLEAFVNGPVRVRWRMYTSLPQTPEVVAAILAADLAADAFPAEEPACAGPGARIVVQMGLHEVRNQHDQG